jgi:hypothetical protein
VIRFKQLQDEEAKGVLPLKNAICYAHVQKKNEVKPCFFNIRTENRDFLVKAESKEDKERWVKAVKSQITKGVLTEEEKKQIHKKGQFIGRTTDA